MRINRIFSGILIIVILSALGCSPGKYISEEDHLLWKNKVKVDNKDIDKSELDKLLKQEPNRRMFLVTRTRLRAYNLGMNMNGRFGNWLTTSFGEKPAILDTNLCLRSEQQIQNYLQSKGFFHSKIDYTVNRKKRLKSKVTYNILTGHQYVVNEYEYSCQDSVLLPFLQQYFIRPLIKEGDAYDEELIEKEREKFTELANRNGFFEFSKNLIHFDIDSNLQKNALNIKMVVSQIASRDSSTFVYRNQKRYKIRKIYIFSDYSPIAGNDIIPDTTYLEVKAPNKIFKSLDSNFIIITNEELKIKPKTLAHAIDFQHGDLYDVDRVDKTYKQLAGLRNFRYINIQFRAVEDSSLSNNATLDCYIRLTPGIKQSYTYEIELTNSAGDPGAGLNLVYQNKNLFRGGEILDIRATGAVEIRDLFNNSEEETIENLPFYIVETGGIMNLQIPKILSPFELNLFPKSFSQKTVIESGYNFQKRPDYTRNIANLYFGYTLNLTSKEQLIFNPFVLNLVKINKTDEFQQKLDLVNNPLLTSQYSDHLISSMQVSYIYRNRRITSLGDHLYFRTNIEESGYVSQLASAAAGLKQDENGSYRIFDIPFTQYIRLDFDFRYYLPINKNNQLAFRSYIGMGPSTGNLKVLPFEKSFFAGGANGNRAWPIRSIGPGSYKDTSNTRFDKIGDYGIETSLEYRFPIYSYLKGAAFIDAGNVWLQNVNNSFPGGEWQWNDFYKELALGAGLGLRIDFDFFIFRLDFGIPIRDPEYDEGDRWRFHDITFKNIHTNVAVGYPF